MSIEKSLTIGKAEGYETQASAFSIVLKLLYETAIR